jgi:hypothetical protein
MICTLHDYGCHECLLIFVFDLLLLDEERAPMLRTYLLLTLAEWIHLPVDFEMLPRLLRLHVYVPFSSSFLLFVSTKICFQYALFFFLACELGWFS